jgi:hypothetical protein
MCRRSLGVWLNRLIRQCGTAAGSCNRLPCCERWLQAATTAPVSCAPTGLHCCCQVGEAQHCQLQWCVQCLLLPYLYTALHYLRSCTQESLRIFYSMHVRARVCTGAKILVLRRCAKLMLSSTAPLHFPSTPTCTACCSALLEVLETGSSAGAQTVHQT